MVDTYINNGNTIVQGLYIIACSYALNQFGPWSSCTKTCGGGSQFRTATKLVCVHDSPTCPRFYKCENYIRLGHGPCSDYASGGLAKINGYYRMCNSTDIGLQYRSCNTACYNGGRYHDYYTGRGGYCRCPDGTKGSCCEQKILSYAPKRRVKRGFFNWFCCLFSRCSHSVVTCGQPASLMNGHIQGSDYSYNQQIRYYCNAKYTLTGSSVRTCTKDGCWTGSTPTCHLTVVTCGQPASLMNGHIQGSDYTYNQQIRYICNAKYTLTGSSVRTCTKDGYWTGSTPTCHFVEFCNSSPCKNSAPCTNLLSDYSCQCHLGWTGKNCETDIQPPVIANCPYDIITHETELEVRKEWQIPVIEDPFGNHVDVTSNYPGNSSVFPWGDFTVQYSAVKPSNGLTTECTFNITTRPHPCDTLPSPSDGIVVCNNWRTQYASVCMTLCKDGYVFATGANLQWYNCGATGNWLPPPTPVQCVPDDVLSVTLDVDLPRLPNCTTTNEQKTLGQFYVQKLKASQFNILCLDYQSNCVADNVVVRC